MAESGQVCISANPDGVTIRQLGSRFWFVAGVVRGIVFIDVLNQPFPNVFAIILPAEGHTTFWNDAQQFGSCRWRNRKLEMMENHE